MSDEEDAFLGCSFSSLGTGSDLCPRRAGMDLVVGGVVSVQACCSGVWREEVSIMCGEVVEWEVRRVSEPSKCSMKR